MLLSFPHPSPHFSSKNPKPPKPFILRSSLSVPSASKPEAASKSAIQRISEKLRTLGFIEPTPNLNPGPGSAGEIFIPTPQELPRHRVGHTIDSSWSTPENPVPEPGAGLSRFRELWMKEKEREREMEREKAKEEERVPTVAELTIPRRELRRLRTVGIRLEKRLKVGKAGITEGIVNGIHERWRRSELVKIKCEDLCRLNMKRTHELLERKTGGLVVWRSGSIIILYRGANYKYPYFSDDGPMNNNLDIVSEENSPLVEASIDQGGNSCSTSTVNPLTKSPMILSRSPLVFGVGSPNKVRLQLPGEVKLGEEADRLLDGLGPRFTDWWGYDPLPVDADLLPPIVPRFRTPFRLLPYGVKPNLTDREMTILKRLSRPLPCHFALGRNRKLQGLAVSMIKLWEKCEVAKIAVKRGVQNTNSELIAEELKRLTGGTLLSRDKEFIVFYRGKDFLPSAVSTAIEERRNYDLGRWNQSSHVDSSMGFTAAPLLRVEQPACVNEPPKESKQTRALLKERRLKPLHSVIEKVETRLSQALEKKEKAEKLLAELEKSVEPPVVEPDKEAITEEERYMLRKVGLRMKPFLLLGRRGVFAGTVENMHLHWKYRELVKIISKDRSIQLVESAARTLEMESGGILVAVERVSKGHAIIIYRGKNYQRPADLRPRTLLNKKEAMKRSLEAQRRESLKLHVLSLSRNIDRLQHQLDKDIDYTSVETKQLGEDDKSDTQDETNNPSGSNEKQKPDYSHHQVNSEEVNEAAADDTQVSTIESSTINELNEGAAGCLRSDRPVSTLHNVDSTISSNNFTKITLDNLGQVNCTAPEQFNQFSSENVAPYTESTKNTTISNDAGHISNEPKKPNQASVSATSHLPCSEDEQQLSSGDEHHEIDPPLYGDELKSDSGLEVPFKAAPLSNRERLFLRKQALKMRKRPVLAVGRNNSVTGVARTIKTHFKKHPLAIVNIKGRAEGTSVQEVIFELEQATGAVLVSREPNKVILYRGWREGEEPGGDHKKNNEGTDGEIVSPELIEAVRVECGLSDNNSN